MNKIRLENISMSFGEKIALDDINLEVEKGKYIVILGPSGAGKTTLLKVIAGLFKPKKGHIYIDEDKNITNFPPEARKIAFLPQNYALFPKKTVWENISFSPKIQKLPNANELIKEFLLMVHLTDRPDAYPHELSGGMKQRTALGRALATNFSIMLLDEPLRALDARLRLELRNELKSMVKDLGFTVFHVTHDQEEAFSLGDTIVILNQGRIQQIGKQEELYRNPINEFVASFLGEVNKQYSNIKVKTSSVHRDGFDYIANLENDVKIKLYSNKLFEIDQKILLIIKSESIKIITIKKENKPAIGIKKYDSNDNNVELKLNTEKSNWFKGTILQKYYLGKYTNIEVKTEGFSDNKGILTAKLSSRKAVKFEPEDIVWLQIKPEHILII